jgi:large subunit ribosomal protein L7/L12
MALCARLFLRRTLNLTLLRHTQTIAAPAPDGTKVYSDKIHKIVSEISELTLKETSDLNELLKVTLNIPEPSFAPAMPMATQPTTSDGDTNESKEKEQQTEFTIKLTKFSADSKVKIIKEIKGLIEGMNLVQAKKFVESVPQIIKENISKEEAEKIKKDIESVGGEVEIE